jgi:formylglycine-generating enzyme required for sulfatase activity
MLITRWGLLGFAFASASCGNLDKEDSRPPCLTLPINQVYVSGETIIGSDIGYREERRRKKVIGEFYIDATEVTNVQFSDFIEATGYVTDAERVQPGFGKKGGSVFKTPSASSPNWWSFVEGANWRQPEGPGSSIEGRETEPVVQVSHADAKAYANWAGRELPSENLWELAAKGGKDELYVWGKERAPNGTEQANTWQGAFPIQNTNADGYFHRAPVGCYSPNEFGVYDMIGNVWEWTDTIYQESEGEKIYTIKGGSFLCAENYCRRYRASARQPQEAGFSTNHIGFRTIQKANKPELP